MTPPIAFHLLPPDRFPFDVEFIGQHTCQTHHTIHVEKPAGLRALWIPSLTHHGEPIVVVIWYPEGPPVVEWPAGEPPDADTEPIYRDLVEKMQERLSNTT